MVGLSLVIATVILLVIGIIGKADPFRNVTIITSFLVLGVGGFINDADLSATFLFALVSGGLMQPFFADPHLTSKTLYYSSSGSILLYRTPHWMALLWVVAIAQLVYVWQLVEQTFGLQLMSFTLFTVVGTVYFYVFELLVGNYAHWWRREHCWQPLNVAVYASFAETVAVALIPLLTSGLYKPEESPSSALAQLYPVLMGVVYGSFVAATFITSCSLGYRRDD